jgi:CDP-glycerol glycerophosphotransferase
MFTSFKGRTYSDSPRCISEALHALRPDIDIVWQLANPADAPDYVRVVKPHTLEALKQFSTVRCFVDNFNRPYYMLKFPDQLYVQTWHGDRPFKHILFDMDENIPFPDYRQMDLGLSGSDFGTKLYRTAFRYTGEVLQAGIPRNDALVNFDLAYAAQVREKLNLKNMKALLFAPTFRDATAGKAQDAGFDLARALRTLEDATGEKWVGLVRAHDQNKGIAARTDERLRDVTAYPEMSDLLLVSDLLITDYSSSAGDFALLDRPVVLYQPDLNTFTQDDRALYFDPRKGPYPQVESEEALLKLLSHFDEIPASGEPMKQFYKVTESGRSAQNVAEWISQNIPKE